MNIKKDNLGYLDIIYRANLDFLSGSVLEGIVLGRQNLLNAEHYLKEMINIGWVGNNIQQSWIKVLIPRYKNTPTEELLVGFADVLEANLYGKAKREASMQRLLNAIQGNIKTFAI